jgi:hypothetical protein
MAVDRCPWYVARPLFGLLIVGLRAVLNKPDARGRGHGIRRAPPGGGLSSGRRSR